MQVAIVGAGPIGQGSAALLASRGHTPWIFSPTAARIPAGASTLRIRTTGALTTEIEVPVTTSPRGLAGADVVLFCILGNAHKKVMDIIAPYLEGHQTIVIVSQCSLGVLYLSKLLMARGLAPTILALATTVTGGPIVDDEVQIRFIRQELDVAAVPARSTARGVDLLRALFGDRFVPCDDIIAITLNNLNPQIHLANCMLNFTRIEGGESWDNYGAISKGVGRLVEALDVERLALAQAFGVQVRSAREHYRKSFPDMPVDGSIHEMAQTVASQRPEPSPGPKTLQTRWLTEDLPFGIAATLAMAEVAGVPTPLHAAGLALLSAAVGRDFGKDNDLLPAIRLAFADKQTLQACAHGGWSATGTAQA